MWGVISWFGSLETFSITGRKRQSVFSQVSLVARGGRGSSLPAMVAAACGHRKPRLSPPRQPRVVFALETRGDGPAPQFVESVFALAWPTFQSFDLDAIGVIPASRGLVVWPRSFSSCLQVRLSAIGSVPALEWQTFQSH